jgi:long-chain acyl-CoA synthetase
VLPELASKEVDDGVAPGVDAGVELGPLAPVFEELEARFEPGVVKAPISYYFSIGSERFTLKLNETTYLLERGRTVEKADCVLQTSPELFRRMVLDGYTPGVREVVTGSIKSNNVRALQDLRRIFRLDSRARRATRRRPKARSEGAR